MCKSKKEHALNITAVNFFIYNSHFVLNMNIRLAEAVVGVAEHCKEFLGIGYLF